MNEEQHIRFHIDLTPEDNTTLIRLAGALTTQIGVRVTKLEAIRLSIRKHFKSIASRKAVKGMPK
jgi:hypothetical protein